MSFELPLLNYNTNSLEPHIDTKTMEIHHGKHHAGYTNNLNNAIKGTDLENSSIEDILTGLDLNNSAVRNNGGGYFNHSLFWNVMSPGGGGEPSGELATAIESSFGGFEEFKTLFSKAAGTKTSTFNSNNSALVISFTPQSFRLLCFALCSITFSTSKPVSS